MFNHIFFPDAEPALAVIADFTDDAVGFPGSPLGGLGARRVDSPIKACSPVGRRPFLRTFALNIGEQAQSYIFQVFMGSYLIQTVGSTSGWCRRRYWSVRCSGARLRS